MRLVDAVLHAPAHAGVHCPVGNHAHPAAGQTARGHVTQAGTEHPHPPDSDATPLSLRVGGGMVPGWSNPWGCAGGAPSFPWRVWRSPSPRWVAFRPPGARQTRTAPAGGSAWMGHVMTVPATRPVGHPARSPPAPGRSLQARGLVPAASAPRGFPLVPRQARCRRPLARSA